MTTEPTPKELDRELQAAIDENQRAFDEEMAARRRQRNTPMLRRLETLLGLRRRRPYGLAGRPGYRPGHREERQP